MYTYSRRDRIKCTDLGSLLWNLSGTDMAYKNVVKSEAGDSPCPVVYLQKWRHTSGNSKWASQASNQRNSWQISPQAHNPVMISLLNL